MHEPFSPLPIEDKLRVATRMPLPRPEFVANLRAQLGEALPPQPAPAAPRFRPSLRPAWSWALIVLAVLLATTLLIGPQKVLAAMRSLFGYVPNVGFVETGTQIRVAEVPVSQEREGISILVTQGVFDAQKSVIHFQVEGIRGDQRPASEAIIGCSQSPTLGLPDGQVLRILGGDGRGWPSGYDARLNYPAVPANVEQITLTIPCINDTADGAAPENWELPLRLIPAPPDFQINPVIEVTQAPQEPPTQPDQAASEATPANDAVLEAPHGIRLSLDKIAELENSYVFQGQLFWKESAFEYIYFDPYSLILKDANGQTVPIEPVANFETRPADSDKTTTWAIQTQSKGYPGPLTLSLATIPISQPCEASFELDLGDTPQDGQSWILNREIGILDRRVKILDAQFYASLNSTYRLKFHIQIDPAEISEISIQDPDNHSARPGVGGGSDGAGIILQEIYYDYIPQGVRHIQINHMVYPLQGPWNLSIELPQSDQVYPTPLPVSRACLDKDSWQALNNDPQAGLPPEIGGQILVEGAAEAGKTFPTLFLSAPDGSNKVRIGAGAWGSLSTDGQKVIYTNADGMFLFDMAMRNSAPVPWATGDDYGPLWSPDGNWIAFTRGNEGPYLIHPDGSELQKIKGTGTSTVLAGWMPDSQHLIVTTLGPQGSQVQTVDIVSGAVENKFVIDNRKGGFVSTSPSGTRIAFSEMLFGKPAYGVYVANLDGSNKRLLAEPDTMMFNSPVWSPDGEWVWITSQEPNLENTIEQAFVIHLQNCQAFRAPAIDGQVTDWK